MLSGQPPTRWRVVERGRRLVTIDSATGQEIGLGANLPPIDLDGTPRARQATPAQRATLAAPATAVSVPRTGNRNALSLPANTGNSAPDTINSTKLVVLAVTAIFLLFILIFTGAWIVVAVALFFAPVRQAILPPIWGRIKVWLQTA